MKSDKIRELRGFCKSAIILKVKLFEQTNAALGIYEPVRCEAMILADSVTFIAPSQPENL